LFQIFYAYKAYKTLALKQTNSQTMMSISNKVTMVARRAVLSSGTGNLRAAVTQRRRFIAPSACCFPLSLTLQAFSERPVVRSRQVVVYDSKANRAATSCVSARTRLMVEIQDAGRKIAVVKAARESVRKVRAELMELLMATVKNEARDAVRTARAEVLRQLLKANRKRLLGLTELSGKERSAVRQYTACAYTKINGQLRKGTGFSREVKTQVRLILSAMRKRPVHRDTVYRGSVLPQSVMDELHPGATFCDRGFMSTTKIEKVAFISMEGSVKFVIESKTGVDISSISSLKHEAEVLFRPGTKFKILSVVADPSGWAALVVTMKELY
jgi:hypothetical protein